MKQIITTPSKIAALATVAATGAVLALQSPAAAVFNGSVETGANAARGNDQPSNLFGASGIFSTITNVLLYIVGAISVIMIIIGAIRYVTSGGNSANVTAAKNTILYAIVGIVVALLGYAIVNFVISSFSSGDGSMGGGGSTGF